MKIIILHETLVVKDVVEHQGVGNPYLAPFEGDTDGGKVAFVMAGVEVAMAVEAAYEEVQLTVMVVATDWGL